MALDRCPVNGPVLSLLQLTPGEASAVPLLRQLAAEHPGVRIITPHYHDEPWRAEIREGGGPSPGTAPSRMIGADWPSGLLAKLKELFGPSG
ncbi:MAG TPA: hypothetical protein VMK84_25060 [Streptosporangiaceae bacterium]|nr:hypothetical protein [Streptosporangiaceae bacterium]